MGRNRRNSIRDQIVEQIELGNIRWATYPVCMSYGLLRHSDIRAVQSEIEGMALLVRGERFAKAA